MSESVMLKTSFQNSRLNFTEKTKIPKTCGNVPQVSSCAPGTIVEGFKWKCPNLLPLSFPVQRRNDGVVEMIQAFPIRCRCVMGKACVRQWFLKWLRNLVALYRHMETRLYSPLSAFSVLRLSH